MAITPTSVTTSASISSQKLNIQLLMKIQGDKAKRWWGFSLLLRLSVIFLPTSAIIDGDFVTKIASFAVPLMSICYPMAKWKADIVKGQYQSLLRKFEFLDGLGWPISSREVSEWLVTLSEKHKRKVTATDKMPVHYFASNKPPSVERLLENLEESAWWSKHIAHSVGVIFGFITIVGISLSVILMGMAIYAAIDQASLLTIAKVAVAVIRAMFSIGFVRLTGEYIFFSYTSAKFEQEVCQVLEVKNNININQEEATKLVHEYQIVRSSAPMLPTLAWKLKEKRLNEIWKKHRLRDSLD